MGAVIKRQDLDQLGSVWIERGDPAILNSCWPVMFWDHSSFLQERTYLCLCEGGNGSGLFVKRGIIVSWKSLGLWTQADLVLCLA